MLLTIVLKTLFKKQNLFNFFLITLPCNKKQNTHLKKKNKINRQKKAKKVYKNKVSGGLGYKKLKKRNLILIFYINR